MGRSGDRPLRNLAPAFLLTSALSLSTEALGQERELFQGKTITIVTSTGPGGTYDLIARMIARHMPRHTPGAPNFIVQNMPGGGNVLATNFLYTIAPKDGTTIGVINNAIPLHQVLDGRGVRFDVGRFKWLGSTGGKNSVTLAWHTAGVRTIEDVMKKEITLGGTGAGSSIVIFPAVMNNVLGTRFKIVTGYGSSSQVNLALERGEVDSRSGSYAAFLSEYPQWISEKKVYFLVQVGFRREDDLPDVPLLTELAKTEEQRQILNLVSAPVALGQPYLAPPDVAQERVAVLRSAFDATLRDPVLRAEADKNAFEIAPLTGDQVAKIIADMLAAPAEVVAKARAAMGPAAVSGGQ